MAQLNFDARTVKPDEGQQDPIPAGWYNVVMDQSEMKPTADGGGMRLAVRFNVIDGPHAGRKIFEGLNLQNSNPVAQEIAYKQLSAIAHAVNVLLVQDSSQLHNIPLKIKVTVTAAQGNYQAKNEVKAYKNINEQVGPVGGPAPAATSSPFGPPPVAAGAPGAPAWVPPTAAQPWANPAQAAPQQAAQQPAWAPPQQPQQAPQQPQQPAWAAAPAPVAAPVAAPAPAPAPVAAPVAAPAAGVVPPWAQQQPAQAAAPAATGAVPPWAQQPAA